MAKLQNPQRWYNNHGKLHREDGPAVIFSEGTDEEWEEWFLYDKKISKKLHKKLTQKPVKDLPLYLGMGFDEFIEKRLKNG